MNPPTLLFVSKTCLAILGPLHFHMISWISLSISAKTAAAILMGNVLNLQANLGCIGIVTVLSLPIHESEMSFHLIRSLLISFNDVL